MDNSQQPAFPFTFSSSDGSPDWAAGLTKREYFAAMAMQGICANPTVEIKPYGDEIAQAAVEVADALLKNLG